MIRVLIADDHSIVRDGIKAILKDSENYTIVGEASNGHEVLEFLKTYPVDIVIMDINMPQRNGIVAAEIIAREWPAVKIIALSMHDTKDLVKQMLGAGAMGYLLKGSNREELLNAIESVVQGRKYFSSEVFNILLNPDGSDGDTSNQDELLTRREKEILKLIAEEYTNPEIAEKLFLSIRTVDTHRRNLLQKLEAKNTAGLVKYALKNKLI